MAWTHETFSLKDLCRLLVGLDAWHTVPFPNQGVPSLMMADGPHGLRKQKNSSADVADTESYPAVCYPPAVSLAASFDPEVARRVGEHIGVECRAEGVHVILGPGLNLKRSPLCGRNFEYFSEDPLVAGTMAKAFVEGVQSQKVGACLKHFALNNQETRRMTSSSVADQRTIRELYVSGFEIALNAKPAMVMCSYNRIDGVYAAEHSGLLKNLLRETFGYQGVVVSDWTAVADRVKSVLATLDLEMPGHDDAVETLYDRAQKDDSVKASVEAAADRLFAMIDRYASVDPVAVDRDILHESAKDIASECIVLLQNDGILPLKKHSDVCLIGELARTVRYQGGGSSHVNPYRLESLADAFRGVNFARGYTLDGDGYSKDLIEEAVIYASRAEIAIVVVGLTDSYESEGYDRTHLDLPRGHDALVEAVSRANPNTVVILQMGSPVRMPWKDKVRAILNGYLGGEAGHLALFDVLYGKTNPSGRLAETFPNALTDLSASAHFAIGNHEVQYRESLYVGYRDLTSRGVKALFPFGHGLSYTTFAYSNLRLEVRKAVVPVSLTVHVDVTNTGLVAGKETVLLFVKNPQDGIFRCATELRAFRKIRLGQGETQTVAIDLDDRAFAYFDPRSQAFEVPEGAYGIELRQNAETVLLETTIQITRESPLYPDPSLDRPSYRLPNPTFEEHDFEALVGHALEGESIQKRRPFTMDDTLEDVQGTWFGRLLKTIIWKMAKQALKDQDEDYLLMVRRSLMETPFRSIAVRSDGRISMSQMMGIVAFLNRKPFQGIRLLLGGKPR